MIHEMFVVDGEEHTGVSEMLVCLRASVFVRMWKCACVRSDPVHRRRAVPARLSLLRKNLPHVWERENVRVCACASVCACVSMRVVEGVRKCASASAGAGCHSRGLASRLDVDE